MSNQPSSTSFVLSEPPLVASRLEELLAANVPPAESEAVILQQAIDSLTRLVMPLSDKREQLIAAVGEIMAQENLLKATIKKYSTIKHPIRSIPDDILVEILEHCIPRVSFEEKYQGDWRSCPSSLDPSQGLWVIIKVCSRWRSLCCGTPALWSEVVPTIDCKSSSFCDCAAPSSS